VTRSFQERAPILAGSLARELDDELQEAAKSASWDATVSVDAKRGTITLSYLEAEETNIFNSEYGNENASPNSVIRPFMVKAEPAIRNAIGQDAIDYLFKEGILP
jgi:hypothetical protein